MNSNLLIIRVTNTKELQNLIDQFRNGPQFASAFEFETEELWVQFLCELGLTVEEFNEKYYYYDATKKIHISEGLLLIGAICEPWG